MSPRAGSRGLDRSVAVFAALGDSTRLQVVARLSDDGPMSITQLTEGTDVTRQAVTKHLGVLAGAGLVRDFRRGRERIWELELLHIEEASRALERISRQWDDSLERLRRHVEKQ